MKKMILTVAILGTFFGQSYAQDVKGGGFKYQSVIVENGVDKTIPVTFKNTPTTPINVKTTQKWKTLIGDSPLKVPDYVLITSVKVLYGNPLCCERVSSITVSLMIDGKSFGFTLSDINRSTALNEFYTGLGNNVTIASKTNDKIILTYTE